MVCRLFSINFELKCYGDVDFVIVGNVLEKLIFWFYYVLDVIDVVKYKVVMIVYCKCNKIFVYVVGGVGG